MVGATAVEMPPRPEGRLAVHLGAVRVDSQALKLAGLPYHKTLDGFGGLSACGEKGGEIVIGEERAQLITHHKVQIPIGKGGLGDTCRLLGDGRDWLRME
jgi:hypothetical protein